MLMDGENEEENADDFEFSGFSSVNFEAPRREVVPTDFGDFSIPQGADPFVSSPAEEELWCAFPDPEKEREKLADERRGIFLTAYHVEGQTVVEDDDPIDLLSR